MTTRSEGYYSRTMLPVKTEQESEAASARLYAMEAEAEQAREDAERLSAVRDWARGLSDQDLYFEALAARQAAVTTSLAEAIAWDAVAEERARRSQQ